MTKQNDQAAWLHGPHLECSKTPRPLKKSWKLILLGAPGIGKGTQAQLLQQRLGVCPLSTGEVFRAAKKATEPVSPAMEEALGHMKRGELVPDETVIAMVAERDKCLQCGGGFLLDGYPRTVEQARALDQVMEEKGLSFDGVISYELDIDKVIERLSGRRTCTGCGKSYHQVHSPPVKDGICDACGSPLMQRADDKPEAIKVRMAAYDRSAAPLKEHYANQGILHIIEAEGAPEEILEKTLEALDV